MIQIVGGVVFNADEAIADWVAKRVKWVPSGESMKPMTALGVVRNGRLVAGVVYNKFSWPDIHITCAADSPVWGSRQIFRTLCNYPFRQLDCLRMTCVTEVTNEPTRRFLEKFGFVIEGSHRFACPDGGTAVSYGLYRETCRWIEPHGKIEPLCA